MRPLAMYLRNKVHLSQASRDAVLLEPFPQSLPAILCLILAIAWTVVGIEPMRRIRVHHDFRGTFYCLQRCPHPFDGIQRDAFVCAAVEAQHGSLECSGYVNG